MNIAEKAGGWPNSSCDLGSMSFHAIEVYGLLLLPHPSVVSLRKHTT